MRNIPHGKGMFIWQVDDKTRIAAPAAAALGAKEAGIRHVEIKAQQGCSNFNAKRIGEYVQAFEDQGIEVWLWGYLVGADWKGVTQAKMEALKTVELCMELSPAGWIIDAEAEYKRKGMADNAMIYMTHLRTAMPAMSVGLCSYRFPTVHPELPWRAFLGGSIGVDFHMPQVYWAEAHNPAQQLVRSCNELKLLRDIPIIPVGAAYTEHGWTPTVQEQTEFFEQAKRLNLPAVSWWEWYFATIRRPEFWPHLAAMEWSHVEPPPPPPTTEQLVARLVEQARLRGWEV